MYQEHKEGSGEVQNETLMELDTDDPYLVFKEKFIG